MRLAPRSLFALLWLGLAVFAVRADTTVSIGVIDQEHLSIQPRSPFSLQPGGGYAPVEITVRNQTGQRGTWDFHFTTNPYGRADDWNTTTSLTVEDGAERTLRLAAPLAWRAAASGGLSVQVAGPGVTSGTGYFPVSATAPVAPFLGLSLSLATPTAGFQSGRAKDSWTYFRPDALFEDWRTISGFDGLWLTAADLRTLSAGQRITLQEWVARGGVLTLFGTNETPGDLREEGLGRVLLQPGATAGDTSAADRRQGNFQPRATWFSTDYKESWAAAESIGAVRPNVLLLTGLVVLLAVINGPINLYVFCGGGRRSRLLWITPIISVVASALLVVFILLQDGVGGRGARYAVIALLPAQHKAAVLQEQISRTGVLFSTGFRLENPSLLVPITPGELGAKARRSFITLGQEYTGDWFGSRNRQGFWLETVIPTRAEVRLLPGEGAPTVVSSIESTLTELYLRTPEWLWHGRQVRTGEKCRLEPVEQMPPLLPEAGRQLRAVLTSTVGRPGWFFATTEDARAFQPTLHTLSWKEQRAVYCGPITAANP